MVVVFSTWEAFYFWILVAKAGSKIEFSCYNFLKFPFPTKKAESSEDCKSKFSCRRIAKLCFNVSVSKVQTSFSSNEILHPTNFSPFEEEFLKYVIVQKMQSTNSNETTSNFLFIIDWLRGWLCNKYFVKVFFFYYIF
jgi:hypothetical protein